MHLNEAMSMKLLCDWRKTCLDGSSGSVEHEHEQIEAREWCGIKKSMGINEGHTTTVRPVWIQII